MHSSKIKRVPDMLVPSLRSRRSKPDFFLVLNLRFLLLFGQTAILTPLKGHHALPASATGGKPRVAFGICPFRNRFLALIPPFLVPRFQLMARVPPILRLTLINNFILDFFFFLDRE